MKTQNVSNDQDLFLIELEYYKYYMSLYLDLGSKLVKMKAIHVQIFSHRENTFFKRL